MDIANTTSFDNKIISTWCPGCGNFGIHLALKNALTKLGLKNEEIVIAGDIGCSSKLPYYMNTYGFCGLHGRVIPLATGIKLANHKLTVIAIGGDGGIYGEGGNHLIHAARRNINITLLVHNNMLYSLTKGQTSPTSAKGFITSVTPQGSIEDPLNPLLLVLAAGASFVARGYAGDTAYLADIIYEAVKNPGFSIVDILQPCVSLNRINDFAWYNERIYKLNQKKDYDKTDLAWAMKISQQWDKQIPTGIIYQQIRPTLEKLTPALKQKTLVEYPIEQIDISSLIANFQ